MMRQPDRKPRIRDTVFLSGWLFADLLLALAVIFLATTAGVKAPAVPPPTLVVTPTHLDLNSPNCTNTFKQTRCTVTLTETAYSIGNVNWTASSDLSTNPTPLFSPASGLLSPGESVSLTISQLPCENDSFTFSGSRGATPVRVLWQCTSNRILEHEYCRIQLNIGSPAVFLSDDANSERSIIEPQLNKVLFLQGRQVGIAIAYGGTIGGTEQQGTAVAGQVYSVLKLLAKDQRAQMYPVFRAASWYESLFTGFFNSNSAIINVYLVVRPNNPQDTCNAQNNVIS